MNTPFSSTSSNHTLINYPSLSLAYCLQEEDNDYEDEEVDDDDEADESDDDYKEDNGIISYSNE